MAFYKSLAIVEFFLVTITIVIQSAPIENSLAVQSSSINDKQQQPPVVQSVDSSKSASIVSASSQEKKKRDIDEDLLNGFFDSSESEEEKNHALHAKIQEISPKIHDKTDKVVNTDDSRIYSENQMTPSQLSNVLRQRRSVKWHDQTTRRRKRALLPYDFYENNPFYDPYADSIEQEEYDRPIRSYAPIYWYPSAYERSLRSALAPSFYESSEWPRLSSNSIDDDDDDDNSDLIYGDEDDDYEANRYPILLESSNNPFDNFNLQQQYNLDDLPFDENLDDEDENDNDDDGEYRAFYPRERLRDVWLF